MWLVLLLTMYLVDNTMALVEDSSVLHIAPEKTTSFVDLTRRVKRKPNAACKFQKFKKSERAADL